MQSSSSWPRFAEPFRRALARNVALAAVAGGVLALQRHNLGLLLPLAALALWFSLGGHSIELAFLNGLRARIPPGRLPQAIARLLHTSQSNQDADKSADTQNQCRRPPHAHVTSRHSLHVRERHGSIRLLRTPVPPPYQTVAIDFRTV